LRSDIQERGILTPIDIDEYGNLLDGHHRFRSATELGIVDIPTIVRLGLSDAEKRSFARQSNILRRHLTASEMRQQVADQLRDTPKWSNSKIGQTCGVDGKTVADVRADLEAACEIPKLDRFEGVDGKERPRTQQMRSIMAENREQVRRVLRHAATLTGDEREGFMGAHGFVTHHRSYNPFGDRSASEIRSWHVFMKFLVVECGFSLDYAESHREWLLRKGFRSPAEWFGDEGEQYRRGVRRHGILQIPRSTITAWTPFSAEHADLTLADIVAQLCSLERCHDHGRREARKGARRHRRQATVKGEARCGSAMDRRRNRRL
jgi:hypothetical protein